MFKVTRCTTSTASSVLDVLNSSGIIYIIIKLFSQCGILWFFYDNHSREKALKSIFSVNNRRRKKGNNFKKKK